MASNQNDLEGILLIDKPSGITSHDVVDRVRRKLRMKRIGHAGTLDPLATGLMIILVGKATKVSQYLTSLDKAYTGIAKLGEETDTQDSDGEVVATGEVPPLTEEQLVAELQSFIGDQYQTPPMYSAKKVKGVPLYKLARKGQEVEREPRFINVSAFEVTDFRLPDQPEFAFYVQCSKGTYIRTLAHDLGKKLGCGAHLTDLRRVTIDKFDVDDSLLLEDFEEMTVADIQKELLPVYQVVPSNAL